MIAEPGKWVRDCTCADRPITYGDGSDDYQNLHTAGVDTAAPTVGGDITNGSPDEKVPSRTELFGIDPIQELE